MRNSRNGGSLSCKVATSFDDPLSAQNREDVEEKKLFVGILPHV